MKPQTKKIIAREGLAVLLIVILGLGMYSLGHAAFKQYKNTYWKEIIENKEKYVTSSDEEKVAAHKAFSNMWQPRLGMEIFGIYGFGVYGAYILQFTGFWLLRLGYPCYWLLRFIRWAVRTLK